MVSYGNTWRRDVKVIFIIVQNYQNGGFHPELDVLHSEPAFLFSQDKALKAYVPSGCILSTVESEVRNLLTPIHLA
jgi:hypothetical protein